MDCLIKRFDAVEDGDLSLCIERGVAYQRERSHLVPYDAAYFDKYVGYEGQDIARKINAGRVALVNKHLGADKNAVDIGIGSGEFIKARPNTWGYDVNPKAIAWLQARNMWRPALWDFRAFCFWDVIEHVDDPGDYFRHIGKGSWVFVSLPVFRDLSAIRESRHYRPGEHLYYWTHRGFVDWMALHQFDCVDVQDFETRAGRDSILSFAFQRSLPSYEDTVAQYRSIHGRAYGTSAGQYRDLFLDLVRDCGAGSVIDYGCGRSDLVAHFWNDGARCVAKYDPAIPEYSVMPAGRFDLAFCCDVLEHVLMADVDRVLAEIKERAVKAVFAISLKPARERLPDGRNAHVTLLSVPEWVRWLGEVFGKATVVPGKWPDTVVVKTW